MNKNILVTGCSRGLGAEIARELLENNCTVYGISRNRSPETEALQTDYTGNFHHLCFDLSRPEEIRAAVFRHFITPETVLHGLVNNAAIAYDDIITNLDLYKLGSMMNVNVYAPFVLVKYFIRHSLLHGNHGSIVHLSSISVHTGYKGLSMYAAGKGALEAFSKNTAREWGERGIRSNCVVAGFMETDMSATLSADQKSRIFNRTSTKQPVSLRSVAATTRFLLSDDAASVTGQNIFVDNGTI